MLQVTLVKCSSFSEKIQQERKSFHATVPCMLYYITRSLTPKRSSVQGNPFLPLRETLTQTIVTVEISWIDRIKKHCMTENWVHKNDNDSKKSYYQYLYFKLKIKVELRS